MFINIRIFSKTQESIEQFLNFFIIFHNQKKLTLCSKTLKKIKKNKKFTILKSPHVNKTAQEQFKFEVFSNEIFIKSHQILKILIVLKSIKKSLFPEIKIVVKFTFQNNTKLRLQPFNPDNFMNDSTNINKLRLKKNASKILKIFDIYGQLKFQKHL
jgi:ribosomal protein S10